MQTDSQVERNLQTTSLKPAVSSDFSEELTSLNQLFVRYQQSQIDIWPQLMDLAYGRLHRIAQRLVGNPPGTPTLGPSALVHEGYAKLFQSSDLRGITTAEHFYSRFARCMRHVLVDYARMKASQKAGGHMRRVDLEIVLASLTERPSQMLEINEALEKLAVEYPRPAQAFELQVFGRMTIAEIQVVLGVSDSTVESDLRFAKAFVRRLLE